MFCVVLFHLGHNVVFLSRQEKDKIILSARSLVELMWGRSCHGAKPAAPGQFDHHLKLQVNLSVLNKIHPERDQVCYSQGDQGNG